MLGGRSIVAAHHPLVVPMHLRLSALRLRAIIVLVVSKQKGITLVFKNDPLENLDVNSTFDSIAVIQKFIQQQIEGQLREMFREDLPGIIHRLSQKWFSKTSKTSTEVDKKFVQRKTMSANGDLEVHATRENGNSLYGYHRDATSTISPIHSSSNLLRRSHRLSLPQAKARSTTSETFLRPSFETHSSTTSTLPEIENYDPFYGLRSDDVTPFSSYSGFGKLWERSRGLAELESITPHDNDLDDIDLYSSYDDSTPDLIERTNDCHLYENEDENKEELQDYEIIPAVGGGTITRPRVWHSQSMIRTPSSDRTSFTGNSGITAKQRQPFGSSVPSIKSLYSQGKSLPSYTSHPVGSQSIIDERETISTPSNSRSNSFAATSVVDGSTAPTSISDDEQTFNRKPYVLSSSPTFNQSLKFTDNGKLQLTAQLNENVSQFSTLSHSNHTLSPFTRSFEHTTIRSFPHSTKRPASNGIQKARRRRVHRIGNRSKSSNSTIKEEETTTTSDVQSQPSEKSSIFNNNKMIDNSKNIKLSLWAKEASKAPKPPPSIIDSTSND